MDKQFIANFFLTHSHIEHIEIHIDYDTKIY